MGNVDFRPYFGSLKSKAFQVENSRGRRYPVETDEDAAYIQVFGPFFVDREKICLSKSFRRLADKTQVFIDHKENSHVRDRKIHTDEVASMSIQIAGVLGLNVCLAEAIALGHDLGHTPFGHLGERAIAEISGKDFRHEIMSVVMAQKVERAGQGLNLSFEVLEGILKHSCGADDLKIDPTLPLEYGVVMLADKIAYVFSDLNDALRLGYFTETELPLELFSLGKNQRERWLNCVFSLVKESSEKGALSFHDSEVAQQFNVLRSWSFKNFYKTINDQEGSVKGTSELKTVYKFFNENFGLFSYDPLLSLALLTDREVKKIITFAEHPTIRDIKGLEKFSFVEILRKFPIDHKIDIFNPDLNSKDFQY